MASAPPGLLGQRVSTAASAAIWTHSATVTSALARSTHLLERDRSSRQAYAGLTAGSSVVAIAPQCAHVQPT
jgi:hypothetical protein